MSKAKVLLIILPFSLIGVIISICSIFRDHHWQGAPEFVDFISRRFFTRFFLLHSFSVTPDAPKRVGGCWTSRLGYVLKSDEPKDVPGEEPDTFGLLSWEFKGNPNNFHAILHLKENKASFRQWQWWDLNFALCSVVICFCCKSMINLWAFPLQTIPVGCI